MSRNRRFSACFNVPSWMAVATRPSLNRPLRAKWVNHLLRLLMRVKTGTRMALAATLAVTIGALLAERR